MRFTLRSEGTVRYHGCHGTLSLASACVATSVISLRTDWGTRYTDCRKIFALCPENLPQTAELSVDRDGDAFEVTGEAESGRF